MQQKVMGTLNVSKVTVNTNQLTKVSFTDYQLADW